MNSDRVKELRKKYYKRSENELSILMKLFSIYSVLVTMGGVVVELALLSSALVVVGRTSMLSHASRLQDWSTINDADAIDNFVRDLLDGLIDEGVSLFDAVVICYNASIHTGVKEVTQLAEYVGVQLIKFSPNSPMLNPIENVFFVFKSEVKSYLALHRDDILRPPPGIIKAEHRANFMLRAAKYSMSTKVTPELCDSEAAHTLSFHARAMDNVYMSVGS
ncbi:LOW QUALITY PROTEIN: Hypothetical protein PHPALM_37803 [Phytophthora palmivora]|uniref:Uncharacterized protein n=1 Tax=Phytophthora palmivora TaxID=4796 RepID=A0A2P4WWI1_9STRA|nr:LOW QUALITY PROTEIN: Hypothetical protein PHPALM_37803 [Phytophthora palmivora]